MICPACQHAFRLRLREYFSLRNRHHCPSCGCLLRLKLRAAHFAAVFIWLVLVFGVPYAMSQLWLVGYAVPMLVLLLCGVAFTLPMDYLMQTYWLKSEAIENDDGAQRDH